MAQGAGGAQMAGREAPPPEPDEPEPPPLAPHGADLLDVMEEEEVEDMDEDAAGHGPPPLMRELPEPPEPRAGGEGLPRMRARPEDPLQDVFDKYWGCFASNLSVGDVQARVARVPQLNLPRFTGRSPQLIARLGDVSGFRLGSGCSGEVCAAADIDGHMSAIKLYEDSPAGRQEAAYELSALLSDPRGCLPRVIAACPQPPMLEIEFIDGITLHDAIWLRHELLTGEVRLHVSHQLASAVAAINGAVVSLRDLKPDNVMLSYPGGMVADGVYPAVRIIDAGMAQRIDEVLREHIADPACVAHAGNRHAQAAETRVLRSLHLCSDLVGLSPMIASLLVSSSIYTWGVPPHAYSLLFRRLALSDFQTNYWKELRLGDGHPVEASHARFLLHVSLMLMAAPSPDERGTPAWHARLLGLIFEIFAAMGRKEHPAAVMQAILEAFSLLLEPQVVQALDAELRAAAVRRFVEIHGMWKRQETLVLSEEAGSQMPTIRPVLGSVVPGTLVTIETYTAAMSGAVFHIRLPVYETYFYGTENFTSSIFFKDARPWLRFIGDASRTPDDFLRTALVQTGGLIQQVFRLEDHPIHAADVFMLERRIGREPGLADQLERARAAKAAACVAGGGEKIAGTAFSALGAGLALLSPVYHALDSTLGGTRHDAAPGPAFSGIVHFLLQHVQPALHPSDTATQALSISGRDDLAALQVSLGKAMAIVNIGTDLLLYAHQSRAYDSDWLKHSSAAIATAVYASRQLMTAMSDCSSGSALQQRHANVDVLGSFAVSAACAVLQPASAAGCQDPAVITKALLAVHTGAEAACVHVLLLRQANLPAATVPAGQAVAAAGDEQQQQQQQMVAGAAEQQPAAPAPALPQAAQPAGPHLPAQPAPELVVEQVAALEPAGEPEQPAPEPAAQEERLAPEPAGQEEQLAQQAPRPAGEEQQPQAAAPEPAAEQERAQPTPQPAAADQPQPAQPAPEPATDEEQAQVAEPAGVHQQPAPEPDGEERVQPAQAATADQQHLVQQQEPAQQQQQLAQPPDGEQQPEPLALALEDGAAPEEAEAPPQAGAPEAATGHGPQAAGAAAPEGEVGAQEGQQPAPTSDAETISVADMVAQLESATSGSQDDAPRQLVRVFLSRRQPDEPAPQALEAAERELPAAAAQLAVLSADGGQVDAGTLQLFVAGPGVPAGAAHQHPAPPAALPRPFHLLGPGPGSAAPAGEAAMAVDAATIHSALDASASCGSAAGPQHRFGRATVNMLAGLFTGLKIGRRPDPAIEQVPPLRQHAPAPMPAVAAPAAAAPAAARQGPAQRLAGLLHLPNNKKRRQGDEGQAAAAAARKRGAFGGGAAPLAPAAAGQAPSDDDVSALPPAFISPYAPPASAPAAPAAAAAAAAGAVLSASGRVSRSAASRFARRAAVAVPAPPPLPPPQARAPKLPLLEEVKLIAEGPIELAQVARFGVGGSLYRGYLPTVLGLGLPRLAGLSDLRLRQFSDSFAQAIIAVQQRAHDWLRAEAEAGRLARIAAVWRVPEPALSKAITGPPAVLQDLLEVQPVGLAPSSARRAVPSILRFKVPGAAAAPSGAQGIGSTASAGFTSSLFNAAAGGNLTSSAGAAISSAPAGQSKRYTFTRQWGASGQALLTLPETEVKRHRLAFLTWMAGCKGVLPAQRDGGRIEARIRINAEFASLQPGHAALVANGQWLSVELTLAAAAPQE